MGESDRENTVEGQGQLWGTVCWSCSYISAQTSVHPGRNTTCGEDSLAPTHNLNQVSERTMDVHYAAATADGFHKGGGGDEGFTSAGARDVH